MTFIDFCSGIGGGRLGLESNGFVCRGFSEIDKKAIATYKSFFDTFNEIDLGDLTKINPHNLPHFDLLISGFPCQSFSIVGKREGLENVDKGQIIYYLAEILKVKKPSYFILENVKGLLNHNKGQTLKQILNILQSCGYKVSYKLLNSLDFGLAQARERVYFVGIREDKPYNFNFGESVSSHKVDLKQFLNPQEENKFLVDSHSYQTFLRYLGNKYNIGRLNLEEILAKDFLVLDTRQSDVRLYENKIPTLRRDRQGIFYVYQRELYKLSAIEALKLQGFDKIENLELKINNLAQSDILRQCGNAMSVNVVESIAKDLLCAINEVRYKMDQVYLGLQTAKNGFKNENFVVDIFNHWREEVLAQEWLKTMGYTLDSIEEVKAEKIKGSFKADVQVVILLHIKVKKLQDVQNLQVKLVSNAKGFNQIDKRWLKSYNELWSIPNDIYEIMQYFVGEKEPKIDNPRDKRRMFFDEFSIIEQEKVLKFFKNNQILILNDILKGRGQFASEWFLVILKLENNPIQWVLKSINEVINFYSGEVVFSKQGSLNIGKVTMQRKGGDGGRESAKMLQFKIDPTLLLDKG